MKATLQRPRARGNRLNLAPAVKRIERASGLPFHHFIHHITANPVCAMVHKESADRMVIRLVDIMGKVRVTIPVKRAFYDAIHEAITTLGVPLHQFILVAIESELARVKGEAR